MISPPRSLEEFATRVVQRLKRADHIAYFAGGCVRDRLLGLEPKDFDVATNALPAEVRELFGERRTLAIGASFGVITILGPKQLGQIEVATFRTDGIYRDGRRPDAVTFSSPEEDASRRDFTINGMFYDPIEDHIIDFVGGQVDLVARTIRAIGDANARIKEDRLRMLRAVRFAATMTFAIESETLSAIQRHAQDLGAISHERITAELQRMLAHPRRATALNLLRDTGLLCEVFPELAEVAADHDRWQHLLAVAQALQSPTLAATLSVLMGSEGAKQSPPRLEQICRRMRTSNETRKATAWIVEHEPDLRRAHEIPFSQLQPLLTTETCHEALSVAEAILNVTKAPRVGLERCYEARKLPVEILNPPALVRGDDLAELGMLSGRQFADALQLVRNAQLDGEVQDRAAALTLVLKWFATQ